MLRGLRSVKRVARTAGRNAQSWHGAGDGLSPHHRRLAFESLEQREMLTAYSVTTLADPGSGGAFSLRQAITAANTVGGSNVINFAGGLTGTIDLAAVLPNVTCGLTINGPGASLLTINGHGYGSVLTFAPDSGATSSTIYGLTITGGSGPANNGYSTDGGGGIANRGGDLIVSNSIITGNSSAGDGGGISNENAGGSSLQLINSTISNNTAMGCGGGISDGYLKRLTVTGSIISGNTSASSGGGIGPDSGFGGGPISVSNSTVSGNTALNGGGIFGGAAGIGGGSLVVTNCVITKNTAQGNINSVGGGLDTASATVTNSTIGGNSATEAGGGVFNSENWNGTMTLINSTVSGNTAGAGGGLYDNANANSTSLVNSTLSGNTATTTTGGGIDNEGGTLTITDSTISGNSAATGGGGVYSYYSASAAGTINGTIVAANTGGDLKPKSGFFGGSNDLIGDGSDQGSLMYTQEGSATTPLNPLLTQLGNFGGPTQTMALLPGSVAIDNGASFPVLDSKGNNITATDQRGIARPQGLAPDIGAFESQNLPVGASAQLTFVQEPSDTLAGKPVAPAIVVYILDANGKPVTTDNSKVTLAVATGPAGAITGGTAAVQAVNGVATFANLLVLTTIPGAVTLKASDGTLSAATSTSFAVSLPNVLGASTTAVAGTHYAVGGVIPIALAFSEAVNVTGTPTLTLNDGAVVNYASGSGTTTLTFNYTVAAGQNTTDLDYASTAALALNGGSILDSLGNPAVLTLPATGTNGLATKKLVIATPQVVSTVTTTAAASSYFKTGGSVPIKITFSGTVYVTGTPKLTLNDGAAVSYSSGSGSATLTFNYTVAAGQNAADLDYASTTALALNGGTIKDSAGTAAISTLPATGTDGLATQNIVIDTTPPTVGMASTTAPANSRHTVGDTVPILLTFGETVNVTGTPQLTLNDGATASYASGSGTSTLTFNYTVAAGQNTTDLDYASTTALTLNGGSILDLTGNAATLTLPATGTDGLATRNLVIDTVTLVVTAAQWTSVSLTMELGTAGKLHILTSTNTDVVTPCLAAYVASIQITSPAGAGYSLTIDSTNGNPVPDGCLNYSGGGSLIKIGSGSAILSATNNYSGGTVVITGKLIVTSASALQSGSNLSVGANAFKLVGANDAVGAPTASPAAIAAVASTAIATSTSQSSRVVGGGRHSSSTTVAAANAGRAPSALIRDRAFEPAAAAVLARKIAWPAIWKNSLSFVGRRDNQMLAIESRDAVIAEYARS